MLLNPTLDKLSQMKTLRHAQGLPESIGTSG